jgi:hypothetical protein
LQEIGGLHPLDGANLSDCPPYKPEIRQNEFLLGRKVPALDPARQGDFLLPRKKLVAML